ncbi:MAG: hypothetical protein K9N38_07330 [Candidatus Marinimicrobia bacterium]|nr:hypothetical protein [Candidatus Neomarinimicrobiota bacterium]MCF7850937.1 hypothetical protein [Candidatus Neomarinimicrobiota bacterium]
MSDIHDQLQSLLEKNRGILRLSPAWVARDFIPPGKRLGLPVSQYNLGDRGGICERWLSSTTPADNRVSVENEGLSFIHENGDAQFSLKEALATAPELIMGSEYARDHADLQRLPKIFDYAERLPYHIHQMEEHAQLVGCSSKEEAYYFPEDVPMGGSPDTYFGVHPYISERKQYDILLDHLVQWKDESILKHARAFRQLADDGFHVPAGTLHAPGSALTIELQEASDVFAMLQAKVSGIPISKDLLYKDVRPEDQRDKGENYILELINWGINGDPYFYENRHTPPIPVIGSEQEGGLEYWIFYNTHKFSGKKLIVSPGCSYESRDSGVYSILAWRGKGLFEGHPIAGQDFGNDELLVSHSTAMNGVKVENQGETDLIIYKFFGPGINADVPFLERYTT